MAAGLSLTLAGSLVALPLVSRDGPTDRADEAGGPLLPTDIDAPTIDVPAPPSTQPIDEPPNAPPGEAEVPATAGPPSTGAVPPAEGSEGDDDGDAIVPPPVPPLPPVPPIPPVSGEIPTPPPPPPSPAGPPGPPLIAPLDDLFGEDPDDEAPDPTEPPEEPGPGDDQGDDQGDDEGDDEGLPPGKEDEEPDGALPPEAEEA